jgi:hypothetical protein
MLIGILIWELPATPGDPKVKLEKLISARLYDQFLNEEVASLQPEGSALRFFIPRCTLIDERQLLNSHLIYEGKLHKTTLTNQVVNTILETPTSERR